jgi:hypothetical protein
MAGHVDWERDKVVEVAKNGSFFLIPHQELVKSYPDHLILVPASKHFPHQHEVQ